MLHGAPSHRPIERVEDELGRRIRSPALPRFQSALAVRLGPQASFDDRLPHGQVWKHVGPQVLPLVHEEPGIEAYELQAGLEDHLTQLRADLEVTPGPAHDVPPALDQIAQVWFARHDMPAHQI